ncbi:hypothetical protein D623_10006284 [Myotis brandtii]|uniref:Uncharacterized protein n=1 Tax=Myotis brandtii TaxID=109478 RepID=S7NHY5_MYOBR|nr:hypothetical protein D623_10006284 [Myotis brandtii]
MTGESALLATTYRVPSGCLSANGDHRSRWMRHELSGRREVPPLQISQRNLAEPHDTE